MSQLLVLAVPLFWLQATTIPPPGETSAVGLAPRSLPVVIRNSSPRGLPFASNVRPNMSVVYRAGELVTTMSPDWFIGAVVTRAPTQAIAKPPSGKAATEADR